MNNYFKINENNTEEVKNILEREKIPYICHTNMANMIRLENKFHVSECGDYILAESRVFDDTDSELIDTNLEVLKKTEDGAIIYKDEQILDDVWEFTTWKEIRE